MEIYCGTDIIEVDRIRKAIEKHENTFLSKIYTENEIVYCESKNRMKFEHYAARFAGKEATYKSISKVLNNKCDIKLKDIEILNDKNGRPYVKVDKLENKIKIDISLSHIKDIAIANCVAYY